MREITINGRPFELHAVRGRVAAARRPLAPATVTDGQIVLVDAAGREHALRLAHWNVACRTGHDLTAVWLIRKGRNSGPYVAIRNGTVDETRYDDRTLAKVHRPLWPLAALAAPALLKLSALSIAIAVAALVYRWYAGIRGRDALKASGVLFSSA